MRALPSGRKFADRRPFRRDSPSFACNYSPIARNDSAIVRSPVGEIADEPQIRFLALASALASLSPCRRPSRPSPKRSSELRADQRHRPHGGRGRPRRLRPACRRRRSRARQGATIFFVHSGDTLSPSLLSGIDKGAHIIDILNHMGVDMMVPGNHEFDFGPENFQTRIGEAKFPIISSNISSRTAARRRTRSTTGSSRSTAIKVGFYGLTTEDTVVVSTPATSAFARLDRDRHRRRRGSARRRRRYRRRRRAHTGRRRLRAGPRQRRRPHPVRP